MAHLSLLLRRSSISAMWILTLDHATFPGGDSLHFITWLMVASNPSRRNHTARKSWPYTLAQWTATFYFCPPALRTSVVAHGSSWILQWTQLRVFHTSGPRHVGSTICKHNFVAEIFQVISQSYTSLVARRNKTPLENAIFHQFFHILFLTTNVIGKFACHFRSP